MRRYNIINNSLGWLCFLIAAITYLLTIEPTASFWDCPEFITQGYKLEVGHPPGNPIFMLTARFFVTLFGGGAQTAAIAVNSMSALLSAGTILLMFWTITHLAKRLMVRDDENEISTVKMMLIMGAGLCGSLAYTWSDTFWFSAVEGEVYAFSSFCTALVVWLIFKWENRADNPGSDRYLILIAYVIGISIAVHLLNLLCIPAIVLVIYYKKFKNTNVTGSLIALAISAAIVALILYGLVPGFIGVAKTFEIFCVNTLGMSYNIGVLIYAVITVAVFIWTIYELRRQKSAFTIKVGMFFSVILSGMPFIGHGWSLPSLLVLALFIYLFVYCKKVPVRIFNIVAMSIFVIFIGYSSYALLLIRSTSNTPMNQNAPDNVIDLAGYLNREQYGDTPLLTGPRLSEVIHYTQLGYDESGNFVEVCRVDESGYPIITFDAVVPVKYEPDATGHYAAVSNNEGEKNYAKIVKTNTSDPDRYVKKDAEIDPVLPDGMTMLFPRMFSTTPGHIAGYKTWSLYDPEAYITELVAAVPAFTRKKWADDGYVTRQELERSIQAEEVTVGLNDVNVGGSLKTDVGAWQPSFWDNLKYFFNYQLNHMYWRYFMWNFAGRQNDLQGNGEPNKGNWISGIPFIDNIRLGDQSLMPEEYGAGNAGHNVFYMLPLLLGILGIIWQALMSHPTGEKRGIEQFWIVFFLFFMTGVAIVLYLNQPPGQPRERDYAFAGSFYAFSIWVGLGVPAIYAVFSHIFDRIKSRRDQDSATGEINPAEGDKTKLIMAGVAVLIGILVPLQIVSQTWDDHDRSDRYAARDFGMNYLNSLDDNAIIFVNGDNDTFPLWYAQEVEGCRPDVKVVNLSYLSQDWYARQVAMPSYTAEGVKFLMPDDKMAYGKVFYSPVPPDSSFIYTAKYESPWFGDLTFSDAMKLAYRRGPQNINPKNRKIYSDEKSGSYYLPGFNVGDVYVPLSRADLISRYGSVPPSLLANDSTAAGAETLRWSINPNKYLTTGGPSQFSNLLAYDIIGTSASDAFKRPVYFASTVGREYYMGFDDNIFSTGMALEVTPFSKAAKDNSPVAAKAYVNIIGKFRWGGLDKGKKIYLDETVRRMVSSTRISILSAVNDLLKSPDTPAPAAAVAVSKEKGLPVPATYADMARNLLNYMTAHMPEDVAPYDNSIETEIADAYINLGARTRNVKDLDKAAKLLESFVTKVKALGQYAASLNRAQKVNLMRNEDRAFLYAVEARANLDYIRILKGGIAGNLSEKGLEALNNLRKAEDSAVLGSSRFLGTGDILSLGVLYTYGLSPAEVSGVFYHPNSAELERYTLIYDVFKANDIDPKKTGAKFLKDIGFTADEFVTLLF